MLINFMQIKLLSNVFSGSGFVEKVILFTSIFVFCLFHFYFIFFKVKETWKLQFRIYFCLRYGSLSFN